MQGRIERTKRVAAEVDPTAGAAADHVDPSRLLAAARRQAPVIVGLTLFCLLLGLIYLFTAQPEYTATTDLLIDGPKDGAELSANIAEIAFDTGAIDSQVEVLKSEQIALSVISSLKLTDDPEFAGGRNSMLGSALKFVGRTLDDISWFLAPERSRSELRSSPQREAIDVLKYNLDVRRISRTYVLALQYTSSDPDKAASIANAFAEAYLREQLDEKIGATRRAARWLQSRLAELKQQSVDSDFAIQRFKGEHGIVATGGDKPGLISDQQLTELDAQTIAAQGETARAAARNAQIEALLKSARTGIAVPDSLANPVINEIRGKYLAASKMEAQLESKLGAQHFQVVSLKSEMVEYDHLIYEELGRIAQSYKSDEEVARARERSLTLSLASLVGQNAATNETLVALRGLEREAETYRSLTQSYNQRYQEALQQQSFPTTEARVITAATPPLAPSYPKRGLIASFALAFGAAAGASVGALRERRDHVFRVGAQVRDELGLEFLGMLPAISKAGAAASSGVEIEAREIQPVSALQRYAIDHPLSSFAETLRSAKIAIDLAAGERPAKVVAVISALPQEGKSTVSKNLASLLSHLGARTLLIDGDLRSPGLTRTLAGHAEMGLLEVLSGQFALADLLLIEPASGLSFLPAVVKTRVLHSSEILSSAAMRDMLATAGNAFEYVIVDLPPLGPVVDVRASASLFDAFVFVVEWGRTPRGIVQNLLQTQATLYEKCAGIVYNKVNFKRARLYESDTSKEYYHGQYGQYYQPLRF